MQASTEKAAEPGSHLSLELLLCQLGGLYDVAAVAAVQGRNQLGVLDQKGTQLEVWDCLLPLQVAMTVDQYHLKEIQ